MGENRKFTSSFEKTKNQVEYKKWCQLHKDYMSLDDFFTLMETKAWMGVFQDFNPREFGADYDIVSIPEDGTPEAEFWLGQIENYRHRIREKLTNQCRNRGLIVDLKGGQK